MDLQQIQVLLDNTWKDTVTGQLIRTSLESFKLELSIQWTLFSKDYDLYSDIAIDCWINHLLHFVQEHNIEIDEDTDSGELLRAGDRFIGQIFADAYSNNILSQPDWRAANRCRLFLRIFSVADLTTCDGQEVDGAILSGKLCSRQVRNIKCPSKGKPCKKYWKCWKRVLQQTLCKDSAFRLDQTLGQWIEYIASNVLPHW